MARRDSASCAAPGAPARAHNTQHRHLASISTHTIALSCRSIRDRQRSEKGQTHRKHRGISFSLRHTHRAHTKHQHTQRREDGKEDHRVGRWIRHERPRAALGVPAPAQAGAHMEKSELRACALACAACAALSIDVDAQPPRARRRVGHARVRAPSSLLLGGARARGTFFLF